MKNRKFIQKTSTIQHSSGAPHSYDLRHFFSFFLPRRLLIENRFFFSSRRNFLTGLMLFFIIVILSLAFVVEEKFLFFFFVVVVIEIEKNDNVSWHKNKLRYMRINIRRKQRTNKL